MSTLYWQNRRLTCAALEKLVEAMPAAERQLVTHLYLYGNELEELPGCLASFTKLTGYVKPLPAPPASVSPSSQPPPAQQPAADSTRLARRPHTADKVGGLFLRLPESHTHSHSLGLGGNQLQTLPDWLGGLTKLEK